MYTYRGVHGCISSDTLPGVDRPLNMLRQPLALALLSRCAGVAYVPCTSAKQVTIHNDVPRRDVNGEYVDAHDGNIVEHEGTLLPRCLYCDE